MLLWLQQVSKARDLVIQRPLCGQALLEVVGSLNTCPLLEEGAYLELSTGSDSTAWVRKNDSP